MLFYFINQEVALPEQLLYIVYIAAITGMQLQFAILLSTKLQIF